MLNFNIKRIQSNENIQEIYSLKLSICSLVETQ